MPWVCRPKLIRCPEGAQQSRIHAPTLALLQSAGICGTQTQGIASLSLGLCSSGLSGREISHSRRFVVRAIRFHGVLFLTSPIVNHIPKTKEREALQLRVLIVRRISLRFKPVEDRVGSAGAIRERRRHSRRVREGNDKVRRGLDDQCRIGPIDDDICSRRLNRKGGNTESKVVPTLRRLILIEPAFAPDSRIQTVIC